MTESEQTCVPHYKCNDILLPNILDILKLGELIDLLFLLPATNPLYERGASGTLKLTHIQNGNGQTEEVWPDYQPLVENTKPRERADSLPGYRTLSIGQKPNQHLTSDRGARSSNYLSLLKDDPEEERMYQTLIIKDVNSQVRFTHTDPAYQAFSIELLGTLRSDNGDVHENVTEKQTSHHFNPFTAK